MRFRRTPERPLIGIAGGAEGTDIQPDRSGIAPVPTDPAERLNDYVATLTLAVKAIDNHLLHDHKDIERRRRDIAAWDIALSGLRLTIRLTQSTARQPFEVGVNELVEERLRNEDEAYLKETYERFAETFDMLEDLIGAIPRLNHGLGTGDYLTDGLNPRTAILVDGYSQYEGFMAPLLEGLIAADGALRIMRPDGSALDFVSDEFQKAYREEMIEDAQEDLQTVVHLDFKQGGKRRRR